MNNPVDGDRILALVKGKAVGEVCPGVVNANTSNVLHMTWCKCNGTGRIRTEACGPVEEAAADLWERWRRSENASADAYLTLQEERAAHLRAEQELRATLEAERAAHQRSIEEGRASGVVFEHQRAEEAEAAIEAGHATCVEQLRLIVAAEQRATEAEARLKQTEDLLLERTSQGEGWARAAFHESQQKLAEAEAARDAALRTKDEETAGRMEAESQLANAQLYIETLREALHELEGQVIQARDGMGIWPYENSPSMARTLEAVKAALATTPTSGFVEKVREVVAAAETFAPTREGPKKVRLEQALTALYTEAPWLKG